MRAVTSISWSDSLEKMAWMQFEWRVTDHGEFIAQVSRATDAAVTTSILLRAAAAANGGEADWVKWIAFSHESISDSLHSVPPVLLLSDQPKTDTGAGL